MTIEQATGLSRQLPWSPDEILRLADAFETQTTIKPRTGVAQLLFRCWEHSLEPYQALQWAVNTYPKRRK